MDKKSMQETKSHQLKLQTQSKSNKPNSKSMNPEQHIKQETPTFDQNIILDRYHKLHHDQYRQLTTVNLSETLKQKLWGFSQGTLLFNQYNVRQMIIENHPLKGRSIMTKQKFHSRQFNRMKQLNIKNSIVAKPEFVQDLLSTPQMRDLSDSIPEHILKEYQLHQKTSKFAENIDITSQNRLMHEQNA